MPDGVKIFSICFDEILKFSAFLHDSTVNGENIIINFNYKWFIFLAGYSVTQWTLKITKSFYLWTSDAYSSDSLAWKFLKME